MNEPPPKPANRGGRPRAEPGTTVTAWVRTAEYERILRLAQDREQSISALVRDLLKLSVKSGDDV